MNQWKRTITCGEARLQDEGRRVVLNGWTHRLRDHGGITFIDLRDRYGVTQVVIDQDASEDLKTTAGDLRFEYCIAVEGEVRPRPQEMRNNEMETGDVEMRAADIRILSTSDTLPFMIDERTEAREDLRLTHRYLDLRSASMQRKIRLRHQVTLAVREYLSGRDFYEIETPTLIRSTPEGARDFLVPSRQQRGAFYALPQSPQIYKQILMVAGFDRYFQIAHCFRDEDARGDRQPEHTQIDMEMSFVSPDDVFEVAEGMFAHIFQTVLHQDLPTPFQRLPYDDAMNRFGSDKPDLRFGMELQDFTPFVEHGDFSVFKQVVKDGGSVKALVVPGGGEYSRSRISELEETAKTYGAKGLAWMKVGGEQDLSGGIAKFYPASAPIIAALGAAAGDLLVFVGSDWSTACTSLGAVRTRLGRELELFDPDTFHFCWIVDFPLFEYDSDESKWTPAHHMFTSPQERFLDDLETNPGAVRGDLYDLVCNGLEFGSGSIRIHDPALQQRVFNVVGINEEEAQRRFGFLLDAFRYGPPPHGGIATGLDRIVMVLAGETTIREVIAFPRNTVGASPMDSSPSGVDPEQLEELGLRIIEEEES